MAAVLRGSTQIVLDVTTDAVAPGQALTLTASVESYTGSPAGNVAFTEGNAVLGTVPVRHGVASMPVIMHTTGIHLIVASYYGPHGFVVGTTPVAITVGQVAAKLGVWNWKHTVVGGMATACDQAKGSHSPYLAGCEAVFSDWLPGAKVTYTLSYADGTRAWISVVATDKNGKQAKSACLRFAVLTMK
jgi:hypothetical protein